MTPFRHIIGRDDPGDAAAAFGDNQPERRVMGERRRGDRRVIGERRRSHRAILIAFWASVFVSAVISSSALWIAYRSDQHANGSAKTAMRAEAAHCVLVQFLRGSAVRTQQQIDKQPHSSINPQRLDGIRQTQRLIKQLEATGIRCPQPSVTVK